MALGFDLYLIVGGGEAALLRALVAIDSAPAGRLAVQARWKDATDDVVVARARRLVAATRRIAAPVLVNGRPELAARAGADGVHLPEHGPPVAAIRASLGEAGLVGASCHDAAGVAVRADADFVVLGPLGEVPGKGPALAGETFAGIAGASRTPIYALGGVATAADVTRAVSLGARGVAVQRAILEATDPARVLRELLAALDRARAP